MLTIAPPSERVVAPHGADAQTETWRDNDGAVIAYGVVADGIPWMHFPGLASFRLGPGAVEVTAVPHGVVDPEHIRDTFERSVLPMMLQRSGYEVLHASAVEADGGVVALAARSESGKSTLAYGLHRRGYALWADDAVAVDPSGSCIRSLPLPFSSRLRPASAAYFESDSALVTQSPSPRHAAPSPEAARPLLGILLLSRISERPHEPVVGSERLAPSKAFVALLPHAYCFSLREADRKRRMMRHYLDIVRHVPVFSVTFRTGLVHLPVVLDRLERLIRDGTIGRHGRAGRDMPALSARP